MMMVFFPIDVIFAVQEDNQLIVTGVLRRFKPFTVASCAVPSDTFLELPAGAAAHISQGDTLTMLSPKSF